MAKYRRWIFASDNHGDLAEPGVVKALFEFKKQWKPEVVIHGGDAVDLRWLRGRASEQEQREKIREDFDAGIDFITKYKPTHFLTGNHDHRLWRAAESDDGKLKDLAERMILDLKEALGDAILYPWCKRRGVMRLGDTAFLHGYHAGVNAVRDATKIYGNMCMGHIHAHDMASVPGLETRVGHSSGSICAVDLDYNRGSPNTLRQSNGWLYGLTYPNGRTQVWHAEKINGMWLLPSEIRELKVA